MNCIYKFEEKEIVILTKEQLNKKDFDGDILFRGQDLAKALGYSNHRDALLRHVDGSDKVKIKNGDLYKVDIKVNNAGENFVTESGMYALILGSELESAKKFKKWVTSEVLPTIRKKGSYDVKKHNISAILEKEIESLIDEKIQDKLGAYRGKEINELMYIYRSYGLTKKMARHLAVKTLRLNATPELIMNGFIQEERDEEIKRSYGQVKAYVRELIKIGYEPQDAWNAYASEVILKTGYDLVKIRGVLRAKQNKKANYLDAAKECGVLKDSVSIFKRFVNRQIKKANKATA